MGLDITAYRGLTKIEVELEDGEPVDDEIYETHARAYVSEFRGQQDELVHGAFYAYEEDLWFRAGSYSGYNAWRETLARFAGYDATDFNDEMRGIVRKLHSAACWEGATGAFSELIDFSDAEGVIGPVTSAKLAKDFAEHEERARSFDAGPDDDGFFFRKYLEWKLAFEMAAGDGMVQFH